MTFEEALKAMREGKKVKRPKQYNPRTIFEENIVEVVTWEHNRVIDYEPLNSIRCTNILAEDWEIIDER